MSFCSYRAAGKLTLLFLLVALAACDDEPVEPTSDIPCEVQRVLHEHCAECHADSPRFGAPMALTNSADFLRDGHTQPLHRMADLVTDRVLDSDRPMPPSPRTMPDEDRQILLDWIDGGLPERTREEQCEERSPAPPTIGPEALPCEPDYRFVAYDGESQDEGYEIPTTDPDSADTQVCFHFTSPVAPGEQATHWAPIIDNAALVHHWILWGSDSPPPSEGPIPCAALPTDDAAFITGWAPGGTNSELPPDVGLDLGYRHYYLQLHYFNPHRLGGERDRSGVAICTSPTPRPHTAGVLTFGTIGIDVAPRSRDVDVEFECPNRIMRELGDLTVLGSGPHMHQLGTRFLSEVVRPDGSRTPLGRVENWDFDNQTGIALDPPVEFGPEDQLSIRCTYDNPHEFPVRFGEGSEDEMCFDFLMVYPVEDIPADERNCIGI